MYLQVYWQCVRKTGCIARAHTVRDEVVKLINEHSHASCVQELEASLAYDVMKERARTTEESNQLIAASLSVHALPYLPSQETIKGTLR